MGTCDFSVIASWLSLDWHVSVGVSLRVCSVLLSHLSVDCFLFCVIWNSPNCDIFYCVIILTTICFNTVKIEKSG